ncbi:MAG: hypothetical protein MZV49_17440 [Rhodopseudomonas palustris]|nr:hypothetical protein [Rhodopseudomonas palustris]
MSAHMDSRTSSDRAGGDPFFPWRLRDTITASAMDALPQEQDPGPPRLGIPVRPRRRRRRAASRAPSMSPIWSTLALGTEDHALAAFAAGLRAQGASEDAILLQLLAPAARRLGSMWEADTIDFASVTIGVSRLQRLLHHFAAQSPNDAADARPPRLCWPRRPATSTVLACSSPPNISGALAGHLHIALMATRRDLTALVAEQWFDVAGFLGIVLIAGSRRIWLTTSPHCASIRATAEARRDARRPDGARAPSASPPRSAPTWCRLT